MKALEINHFSFRYKPDRPLLEDISFSLDEGEIFCLLGPNGSGKTTLISQILFANARNKESIRFFSKSVAETGLKEMSKLVGYVPQRIGPLQISVLQTVVMGRYPYQDKLFIKPTKEDYEIAYRVIDQMGLSQLADCQFNTLSGGEIQRVFIAQCLAKNAKLYFFDEPMSALDPEYQANFLKIITWLSENGAAVFFTTHNPNHFFALKKARVAIMDTNHHFSELAFGDAKSIEKIEESFKNALNIQYSEQHKAFVSNFSL